MVFWGLTGLSHNVSNLFRSYTVNKELGDTVNFIQDPLDSDHSDKNVDEIILDTAKQAQYVRLVDFLELKE